jgi:hypothetical protein
MVRRIPLADRRSDETFGRVMDSFLKLLAKRGFASKDEVMKDANASGIRDRFPWLSLIYAVRREQPGVLIISLTKLIFYGPRAKARQGVTPNQYIAKTYKAAFGFASVAQFVQMGDLERSVVETRYKQQEIRASKALEHVKEFRAAITQSDELDDAAGVPRIARGGAAWCSRRASSGSDCGGSQWRSRPLT